MRPGPSICIALTINLLMYGVGTAQPGPGGPPPGGPGFGGGRFMMPFERNVLQETLATIGDLNLSPGFTLSAEQKQQIQTIRDEFRKQQEAWRAEHADELKEIDDRFAEMRDAGGPPDPDQMRELMDARRELMSTSPDGEAQSEQVIALLTDDQKKQFEVRQAQIEKDREQMRPRFMPGGPGRR